MPLILRLIVAIFALCLTAGTAGAACTVTQNVTANIGARTSYEVLGGTIGTLTTPVALSCPEGLVNLLSADYARATAVSTHGFRLQNAAGDGLAYRLSADSAGSYTFAQGGSINYLEPQLLSLLGIGASTLSIPMFVAPTQSPNLPAGTYTDTVTINWSWSICRGIGALGACILRETGSGTSVMTVTLTVTQDCRISAPPVSFGSAPLAAQFARVAQTVTIACTKGASYAIGFTAGTGGASRPWRSMSDGAGHALQYNIYRADGTTIWDETNPLPVALPGSGAVVPDQPQAFVARINPDQNTPPPGNYSDTVSVVVTF